LLQAAHAHLFLIKIMPNHTRRDCGAN